MATDTHQEYRRKHHRSTSDDEPEKSSKRHKHRHHRHRHHRTRKHEDETKHGGDDIPSHVPANVSSRVDDDVEEGEILDEDNLETKKLESVDADDSRNPVCSDCL
ncbi:hypothetical protein OWV82_016712 [Melia azedarach]|uniref:Uncharacterized protein n=1 Tax=Melia azedarach TaxID=155640 RepID=A0ACC1XII9_MELAZ|nr:hypothetical protein OWV82_016712 [Melia azedarach]